MCGFDKHSLEMKDTMLRDSEKLFEKDSSREKGCKLPRQDRMKLTGIAPLAERASQRCLCVSSSKAVGGSHLALFPSYIHRNCMIQASI